MAEPENRPPGIPSEDINDIPGDLYTASRYVRIAREATRQLGVQLSSPEFPVTTDGVASSDTRNDFLAGRALPPGAVHSESQPIVEQTGSIFGKNTDRVQHQAPDCPETGGSVMVGVGNHALAPRWVIEEEIWSRLRSYVEDRRHQRHDPRLPYDPVGEVDPARCASWNQAADRLKWRFDPGLLPTRDSLSFRELYRLAWLRLQEVLNDPQQQQRLKDEITRGPLARFVKDANNPLPPLPPRSPESVPPDQLRESGPPHSKSIQEQDCQLIERRIQPMKAAPARVAFHEDQTRAEGHGTDFPAPQRHKNHQNNRQAFDPNGRGNMDEAEALRYVQKPPALSIHEDSTDRESPHLREPKLKNPIQGDRRPEEDESELENIDPRLHPPQGNTRPSHVPTRDTRAPRVPLRLGKHHLMKFFPRRPPFRRMKTWAGINTQRENSIDSDELKQLLQFPTINRFGNRLTEQAVELASNGRHVNRSSGSRRGLSLKIRETPANNIQEDGARATGEPSSSVIPGSTLKPRRNPSRATRVQKH